MTRITFVLIILATVSTSFAQQANQLKFREEIHDFGTIGEEKGPVTHEFVFTNNSTRPVRILKVQASCGCTTPGWSKEAVAPGQDGYIQASYNPKGRPGFFSKSLTITTDLDPNPVILQIKGHVSNEAQPAASDYDVSKGNLKMKVSSFNMGRVYLMDEYAVREFPVINGGADPVHFTGVFRNPPYIGVDVQPRTLAPGEKAVIKLSYNGAQKNQYGFQTDNVEIETDDPINPVKSFSVYATLEEFFPEMSAGELAKAPQLSLAESTMDFGRIQAATVAEREVRFTNTGKKELKIRSLQPNCTCITAEATATSIKPGNTGTIKITFDPSGRTGTQNKAISLYSNDPRNPVQRFTFTAYVEEP